MWARIPATAAVVFALLALAGCGSPEGRNPSEGVAVDASPANPSADTSRVILHPATAEQVLEAVRAPGAKATLVNVWATWCVPCREEFPDLVRLERNYRSRGLRVLFVCADFDTETPAAKQFLAEHGVSYPSYLKMGDDMQFINTLSPKWSGALPASILYDATGSRRDFWEGKASYATFEAKVIALLEGRTLADSTEVDS